jgi:hypothetical protein
MSGLKPPCPDEVGFRYKERTSLVAIDDALLITNQFPVLVVQFPAGSS